IGTCRETTRTKAAIIRQRNKSFIISISLLADRLSWLCHHAALAPGVLLCRIFTGDTTENDAAGHGVSAETHGSVDTAGNLSGGVKPFNRFKIKTPDLSVLVDDQTTHCIMHFRPEPRDIERSRDGRLGIPKDHAMKIIVLLLFHKGVPAGDFFEEHV